MNLDEFDSLSPHILMLHNRYQYTGGEDSSTQAEIDILKQFGHQVTYIEEHNDCIKRFSAFDKSKLFFTTAWNPKKAQALKSQLKNFKPDILHVQNFFPLFSPSVHQAAQSLNIPTVQHLRNFRLGCLNASLFRENQVCEVCIGKNSWRGIVYRCYRGSLPGSLAVWNMITVNRWRKTWEKNVDAFITPSQFAANKLIQMGIPGDRLYVKPNVTEDPLPNQIIPALPKRPTFLFIGRLSSEKGVMILLKAWEKLNQPEWQLNIAGDGPQKAELMKFVRERGLTNVTFLGQQTKEQVIAAVQNATAVLVPSQWYETFGRVVIEAFACGRAAIVSDLGALAELVKDQTTGFLVSHSNIDAWVERLEWAGTHPLEIAAIGQSARLAYQQNYTPEINYQQTMDIYQRVLMGKY
ncbi:glycosyltransferase family 4 protein [Synechococcus sp. BDU 130192]|uniref:glycosyltransferase family 4 protein n=1 Tax=Synechococcus sp. BDU 130192 TaxID=2042059 RepID=UPI000C07E043|nr:glycosyltransferase family 4 protein [Synechococcus sp. BDU 130192]